MVTGAGVMSVVFRRTLEAYESWMQRSRKTTDFIIPVEVCVMINVVLHFKSEVSRLTDCRMEV